MRSQRFCWKIVLFAGVVVGFPYPVNGGGHVARHTDVTHVASGSARVPASTREMGAPPTFPDRLVVNVTSSGYCIPLRSG